MVALLLEEEPKTRGKNLFKFDEEEKLSFQKAKIEKRIRKQEELKEVHENKSKIIHNKIQRHREKLANTEDAHKQQLIVKETHSKFILKEKKGNFLPFFLVFKNFNKKDNVFDAAKKNHFCY